MNAIKYIGYAGWAISSAFKDAFPDVGTHLQRYATRLSAVEINSCFYKSHQPKTYAKWAACVPEHFRFSTKLLKTITHQNGLQNSNDLLAKYFDEAGELGKKLGVVLVQLPPKLAFDQNVAEILLAQLRHLYAGAVVIEPRHKTWFAPKVNATYKALRHRKSCRGPSD